MADTPKTIFQFDPAGPLTGTEIVVGGQAGKEVQIAINNLIAAVLSSADPTGTAVARIADHLAAFSHADIAHTNRTALNAVSGINTGDQDLSGILSSINSKAPIEDPALTGEVSAINNTGLADRVVTSVNLTTGAPFTSIREGLYVSCIGFGIYAGSYATFSLSAADSERGLFFETSNMIDIHTLSLLKITANQMSLNCPVLIPDELTTYNMVTGSIATGLTTRTSTTYTVESTISCIIANYAGTMTLTLPDASEFPGRILQIKTITANTVISASANVVPLAGGAAGTAILAATAGKFAQLQSNGIVWHIIMAN